MQKASSSEGELTLPPGLRRYLYFTAMVCGAGVLIVEILGAKMLAPYFGNSHFVWTAQIAVTLLSLSVGYYLGGWLADRSPHLNRLFTCILVAAVYLAFSIPLCPKVAEACLELKLALGSLLTSAFLFFVPLALLATVAPFLIRAMTFSITNIGGQVGRLSALSTVGSVLGTVLIGYVLIPFLPNSATMACVAVALMLLAVAYFAIWGQAVKARAVLAALLLAGIAAGYHGLKSERRIAVSGWQELAHRNSNFGLMQVILRTNDNYRLYLNDYLAQNGYDPAQKRSIYLFTYMLHGLARAYTAKVDDALCIGMGIGIVPMQFAREGVKVDVVEINPGVVPLAKEYFDFEPERVQLFIDDGRHLLNRPPRHYDTIVLDAFLGDSSPSHLMTREAFTAMRNTLNPGGTLVINSFGDLEPGHDFFTASLERTLQAVFKSVKIHKLPLKGNTFFVASDRPELEFAHPPAETGAPPNVQADVDACFLSVVGTVPSHGRVLTDNFNPVEYYDAANREVIRKGLTAWLTAK